MILIQLFLELPILVPEKIKKEDEVGASESEVASTNKIYFEANKESSAISIADRSTEEFRKKILVSRNLILYI